MAEAALPLRPLRTADGHPVLQSAWDADRDVRRDAEAAGLLRPAGLPGAGAEKLACHVPACRCAELWERRDAALLPEAQGTPGAVQSEERSDGAAEARFPVVRGVATNRRAQRPVLARLLLVGPGLPAALMAVRLRLPR